TKSIEKNYTIAVIQLIAPNPFWYDPTILTSSMVGFTGGFSLPFSFPINFGTVGTNISIDNTGDVSTPILLTFTGEIVDPVITNNTTGESIIIVKQTNDGDTLVINTAFGAKSVQILSGGVYSNAFEYVDPDSVFWQLQPGINSVSYTATSEGPNASAQIQYYKRFSGV
ncbi:MAG: phage tail family protein, partial [archaeon]